MEEKRFAVLLTDTQDIQIMICDPQRDMFDTARQAIGCDWIEIAEADPLAKQGMLMLIDEEGKLKPGAALINCTASHLYGSEEHGDPIIGNAMIVKCSGEDLELMTKAEATELFARMEEIRPSAIARITERFSPRRKQQMERKAVETLPRQPCRQNDQER